MTHCMAIFISSDILFFIVASFLFTCPCPLAEVNQNDGFSIDLIPVDSIVSPERNSSATRWDHVNNAILRSMNRAEHGSRSTSLLAVLKRKIVADGDFLMRLSIGTPPLEITGLADTGGNFTWMQCEPCRSCYPQKSPLFAPRKSSTYVEVHSNTKLCDSFGGIYTNYRNDPCGYHLSYADDSYSYGVISLDTVTLNSDQGSPVSKPNIVFGCGHRNYVRFNTESSGVIGLGGGPGSLITQMKDVIGGRFSYCLVVPYTNIKMPSKMHFGLHASASGPGTISTPYHIFRDTLYAARFKGLSVGDENQAKTIKPSRFPRLLNYRITIESGTLLTHLPRKYYNPLELAIKQRMDRYGAADPNGKLKVCYKSSGTHIKAPTVTLHLVGADLRLRSRNTFVEVDKDIYCLGIVPHDDEVAVLGGLAQRDYLVAFDLNRKTVSFSPTLCSNLT